MGIMSLFGMGGEDMPPIQIEPVAQEEVSPTQPKSLDQVREDVRGYIMQTDDYRHHHGAHLEEIGHSAYKCPGCYAFEYEYRVMNGDEVAGVRDMRVEVKNGTVITHEILSFEGEDLEASSEEEPVQTTKISLYDCRARGGYALIGEQNQSCRNGETHIGTLEEYVTPAACCLPPLSKIYGSGFRSETQLFPEEIVWLYTPKHSDLRKYIVDYSLIKNGDQIRSEVRVFPEVSSQKPIRINLTGRDLEAVYGIKIAIQNAEYATIHRSQEEVAPAKKAIPEARQE